MANLGMEMRYFVLKPKGDNVYAQASRVAMQVYADFIRLEDPQMAEDLYAWLDRVYEARGER